MCLLTALAGSGQYDHPLWPGRPDRAPTKEASTILHPTKAPTPVQRSGGNALYSEDFENGLNGWTVNTLNGSVDWQLTTTGNTGGFTPGPLQSTTGFPGGKWIVADSDLNGIPGVLEHTTITSPPITGLDTVAHMLLFFEQSFRQLNNDETTVDVSGNGGSSWTSYPVNLDVAGNQSTPGSPMAETVVLNISDALSGGSSDIRIRFSWYSAQGFTYSWQVDDIALVAALPNDLRLLGASHSQWDTTEPDFAHLPYTVYPTNEVRELLFNGEVINNGAQTQTNVRLRVDVDGPSTNNVTLWSTGYDLAPGETRVLTIPGYSIPAVNGNYDITYTVVQDETEDAPQDNVRSGIFRVSPYIFARDEGALEGEYDNSGAEYQIGNWFHITDWGNTLTAVDVALSERSDIGTIIAATVYDGGLNYLTESEEHIVATGDLNDLGEGHFITLPLISPVDMDQGEDYFVALHHYGGSQELWTGTSGSSLPQTSLFLDGTDNTWYYVTVTPMVRMNLDPSVGLSEMDNGAFHLDARPTLFQETTRVSFTLSQAGVTQWQLLDMTGKLVQQMHLGELQGGTHRVDIDATELGSGVYLFRLNSGSATAAIRLVKGR